MGTDIDSVDVSSCYPGSAVSYLFATHAIMWQGGQTDGQADREWCPCNATVAETMSCQSQRPNCCGVNTLYALLWCRPCQVIVVGVLCIWRTQWYSESLMMCLYICRDVCPASGKWEESTSVNSLRSTLEHSPSVCCKHRICKVSFIDFGFHSVLPVVSSTHQQVSRPG